MTVGRKGHRAGEFDDDTSEGSGSQSPPSIPTEAEVSLEKEFRHARPEESSLSVPANPRTCTLPSFDAFLRDTFHRRSLSTPGSREDADAVAPEHETKTNTAYPSVNRVSRTLSGTWLRDDASTTMPYRPHPSFRQRGSEPTPHSLESSRSLDLPILNVEQLKLSNLPSIQIDSPPRAYTPAALEKSEPEMARQWSHHLISKTAGATLDPQSD